MLFHSLLLCAGCCQLVQGVDDRVVIELFAEYGQEFTAIVLDVGSKNNSCPVTLLPTEVEGNFILFFMLNVRPFS